MSVQFNSKFISFKGILALIVITAIFAVLPASVAAAGGDTPATAVIVSAGGTDTGSLEPLEQHWYKFTPTTADVEQTLTLIIEPNKNNPINFTTFNIYNGTQVKFYSSNGAISDMAVYGAGEVVSLDNDANTGKRTWTGAVSAPATYYVLIYNESDFSFDYTLLNTSTASEVIKEEEVEVSPSVVVEPETPAEPDTTPPPAAPKETKQTNTPGDAEVLPSGRVEGRLAPQSTYWYTFNFPDPGIQNIEDRIKSLKYTMFFTPDDGNRRHYVDFKLYPYNDFQLWQRGDSDQMTNFGAGTQVDRDGDDATGERLWSGTVLLGDQYFFAVTNGTDVPIDYYIYDSDISRPILGKPESPQPRRIFAQGEAPEAAAPIKIGRNDSKVQPGGEEWYTFRIIDLDNQKFEEMALTMICTPDDGNRIRNVTFDVYTADGVKYWSPGVNADMRNLGAGSVVYRDDNFLTGERFWSGWVNDGDIYYVQIRNGADVEVDCHLFTGDVYGPELGAPTPPKGLTPADPGKAPYTAQSMQLDVTDNQLKPGQEQWYTFSRSEGRKGDRIETIFTMIFTPDDGNRKHRVGFQLFEGNQLKEWAPDNRFNLLPFGSGQVVERDGGIETGELLWKGHVNSGDTYYMRVYNESDETIDLLIFPDDVISTNLQQGIN